MLEIGDRVLINMPLQAVYIKNAAQKRHFNHKRATVLKILDGNRYLLDVDAGRFEWDESILARQVCKN